MSDWQAADPVCFVESRRGDRSPHVAQQECDGTLHGRRCRFLVCNACAAKLGACPDCGAPWIGGGAKGVDVAHGLDFSTQSWVSKNGRRTPLAEMAESHLVNCVRLVARSIFALPHGSDESTQAIASFAVLVFETVRRGITPETLAAHLEDSGLPAEQLLDLALDVGRAVNAPPGSAPAKLSQNWWDLSQDERVAYVQQHGAAAARDLVQASPMSRSAPAPKKPADPAEPGGAVSLPRFRGLAPRDWTE